MKQASKWIPVFTHNVNDGRHFSYAPLFSDHEKMCSVHLMSRQKERQLAASLSASQPHPSDGRYEQASTSWEFTEVPQDLYWIPKAYNEAQFDC